jgi:xylulokinase
VLVLGIDVGTTSTKALLLGDDLKVVAEGSAAYPLLFTPDGGIEQNPEDWWNACCGILASFWQKGADPKGIGCIAVSGHGASLVVTGQNGELLRPAISSLDTRCSSQTDRIRRQAGKRILEINGNAVGAFNFEPKLLWLKETEPHHYRNMPCFLSAASFINLRLTGERIMNRSDGGIGMSYDRMRGTGWSAGLIEDMGLDLQKFPPVMDCGEIIGTVTGRAAEETGLPAGIPVLAGGEDTSSAALAVGVIRPGNAFLSLGTQGTVGVCTDQYSPNSRILGFPHVLSGLSLLSGSMSTFGAGLQWFVREWCRDLLMAEEQTGLPAAAAISEACAGSPPGAKGLIFLPYLSGALHPELDEHARGMFFGLRLDHTREDMARALLEGTAHDVKHNLDTAESAGGKVEELRAIGGPTRSPVWCQAIADITGKRVRVVAMEGGCGGAPLGNAMLALNRMQGCALSGMLDRCLTTERVYEPNPLYLEEYEEYHRIYRELYSRTKELLPRP